MDDDRSTVTAVEAELVPNGAEKATPETPSAALAKVDAADVETVFARVEQAISELPSTVKAIEWRDGLKAVEAAAAALNRRDIRTAAARAVAEVEQWIAGHNPARPVGRPRKTEVDENLGQRPAFSEAEGEPGEPSNAASAEELREIRRAHPDPEDDAALRERMQRIEATGKVVSRRALREEVRRERQNAHAEPASQDAATADEPRDGSSAAVAPADAAAVSLHVCATEALCDQAEADSIAAVAVALHSVEETLIGEVLSFAGWAVRPAGLVLVQCPVWAVADVMSIGTETDVKEDELMDYESLLVCVGTGSEWFPVVVFRRPDDDPDSAVDNHDDTDSAAEDDDDADTAAEGPTLFRAETGSDAWRQVITAWLPAGSEVWDPCCGSGEVLVGAAAAGMRIVGLDADAANIAATRAALRAAAGVAPKRGVDRNLVTR